VSYAQRVSVRNTVSSLLLASVVPHVRCIVSDRLALEHANAALLSAQASLLTQQLAGPSCSLVEARRVLAQISECSIMFADDQDNEQTSVLLPGQGNSEICDDAAAESGALTRSCLFAASVAAQSSIDEASDSARFSRYSAHEALLVQARSAISEIPPSPTSPVLQPFSLSDSAHFALFSGDEPGDDCDDSRQVTLYQAMEARCSSFLETSQLPPSSVSEELNVRSRSAITIQRAWRRPMAYFDCAMSASESLNCSVGALNSSLIGDEDESEAEVEALFAFDEALTLFERSVGTTLRA
jgi:hypothetical protein